MIYEGNGYTNEPEYEIPHSIKKEIPDYFYYALAGELASVFGSDILYEQNDDFIDLDTSTYGWAMAFMMACKKLDLNWLMEYRKGLDWYESDLFDGEIEEEVIQRYCMKDHGRESNNCYYVYLLEQDIKENEEKK